MKEGQINLPVDVFSESPDSFDLLRRGASTLALVRLAGFGLSFALSVVMAHWLNAAEFGTYTYVLSWVGMLGTMGVFGLDRVMMRDVSVYSAQAAWSLLRGLLRWANGIVLLVSCVLLGLVFIVHGRTGSGSSSFLPDRWLVGGLLIPVIALSRVQQSTLCSLNRLASSQIPEAVFQPMLILLLVCLAIRAGIGRLTAVHALVAFGIAAGIALVISVWLVSRALPREMRTTPPLSRHRAWMVSSFQMFLITGVSVVNSQIDILLLGVFRSLETVGSYAVALRGAALIPLGLNIAGMTIAPTYASLYASGKHAELQRLVTRISWLSLLAGLPVAVGLFLFGRWFLLFFGPDFTSGQTALTILSLGQLVNIVAGPVALLLAMTGHERDVVIGIGLGAGTNLLLSLTLIPLFGINGGALAAAASLMVWNGVLVWFVRQRLAICPMRFRAMRPRSIK